MVENDEYAAFLRRGIRAMGKRAGSDPEALVLLRDLEADIDAALNAAVENLHTNLPVPYSYGEIAQRLGVTRQAVQKRWGGPGEPTEEEADRGLDSNRDD